jgi:hypothetical protein
MSNDYLEQNRHGTATIFPVNQSMSQKWCICLIIGKKGSIYFNTPWLNHFDNNLYMKLNPVRIRNMKVDIRIKRGRVNISFTDLLQKLQKRFRHSSSCISFCVCKMLHALGCISSDVRITCLQCRTAVQVWRRLLCWAVCLSVSCLSTRSELKQKQAEGGSLSSVFRFQYWCCEVEIAYASDSG